MTIVFIGEMRGVPYHRQIRQFNREYIYGKPENCSVVLFLIRRRNVSKGDRKSPNANMCPATPAAPLQIEKMEPKRTIYNNFQDTRRLFVSSTTKLRHRRKQTHQKSPPH